MEMVGLVLSCCSSLRHINLQSELQPDKTSCLFFFFNSVVKTFSSTGHLSLPGSLMCLCASLEAC